MMNKVWKLNDAKCLAEVSKTLISSSVH